MLQSHDDCGRSNWSSKVKDILYKNGFWICLVTQEIGDVNIFIKMFKQRLIDCYIQNWHDDINMSRRCYHYKHFKSLLTVEKYLVLDIPLTNKRLLSKIRCSSHTLRIEVGRHLNIPREERICIHCLTSRNVLDIDCELHAFFYCCKYNDIQAQYLLNWYDRPMEIPCALYGTELLFQTTTTE